MRAVAERELDAILGAIAGQLRALADRLDPQPAPDRIAKKRSARRRTVLLE